MRGKFRIFMTREMYDSLRKKIFALIFNKLIQLLQANQVNYLEFLRIASLMGEILLLETGIASGQCLTTSCILPDL